MNRRITALSIGTAAALCACSPKDAAKPDSTKGAAQATQAGATAAGAAGYDPATHTATIHAKDFAFETPDSVPAGWTNFHLVNDGPANIHHAQLVRLDSGKTLADLGAAMKNPGPPPRWAVFVGGANAPDPMSSSDAAVNLTPGDYVVICLVDTPDHMPHFAKGMMHAMKVTAASGPAAPEPASDVTVTLSDYAFGVATPITAGKHTFKIVNNGPQPHEFEVARLEPGKTVKDLAAYIYSTAGGPPPGHALGGSGVTMPGMTTYATLDLTTPGNYAILCFVPAPDGKEHLEHGMIKEFTIK